MADYTYTLRMLIGLAIALAYTYAAFEYKFEPELYPIHDPNTLLCVEGGRLIEAPPPPIQVDEEHIPITHQQHQYQPTFKQYSREELGEALKGILEEEENDCAPIQHEENSLNSFGNFHVQAPPSLVGGTQAFYEFIREETNYPPVAKEQGIEGKVFVSFIVKTDGTLRCITIIRGVHPLLDEEALRVLMLSPKWIPSEKRGKLIEQKMIFPFNFKLKKRSNKSLQK